MPRCGFRTVRVWLILKNETGRLPPMAKSVSTVKNVLFIMCDQLRWNYLSCMGHPHLKTQNIDALADRGTLFEHAFCPAPLCGPSRMAMYTGRYMSTTGAAWNNFPLRLD